MKYCEDCEFRNLADAEICYKCGALGAAALTNLGVASGETGSTGQVVDTELDIATAVRVPKHDKVRIKNVVTCWVFAVLFLLMALVSLGSVATVKMDYEGFAIKPQVTGIDLLCAPFRTISPLSFADVTKDFSEFFTNNAEVDATTGTAKTIKEFNRTVTKYGFMKLSISEETLTSNQFKIDIALMSGFYYLFLLTALALFIMFLVRAVKVTLGKCNQGYRFGSLLAAATASIIAIVCLVANMLPAAAAIMIYTFAIVSIVGIAVANCVVEKKKISGKKMASQAASVVLGLSLFSLTLLPSTVMKVTGYNTNGSKASTVTEKNQFGDYIAGLDYESEYGLVLGQQSFENIADFFLRTATLDKSGVEAIMQPSVIFGYQDTSSYKELGICAALFSLIALAFVSIGLAGVVATSLAAMNGSKAGKFTHFFIIAAFIGFVFMLASCIMVTVGNNALFKEFEIVKNFKTSIGAASIVGMVLTFVMLVQHLVVNVLCKKEKIKI